MIICLFRDTGECPHGVVQGCHAANLNRFSKTNSLISHYSDPVFLLWDEKLEQVYLLGKRGCFDLPD